MQSDSFALKGLRKLVSLHADEAYDHICGTYLSARWAIRDLAERHGLTEEEVEEDIKSGFVTLPVTLSEPAYEPLEKENFRIRSADWEVQALSDGTGIKTNRERDVWELLDGDFAGEQFFTLKAAYRETEKVGKRIPTEREWDEIIRTINPEIDVGGRWHDDVSVRETLGLKLAGYRAAFVSEHYYRGVNGFYWVSDSTGTNGRYLLVNSRQVVPAKNAVQANGFSVRCLAA